MTKESTKKLLIKFQLLLELEFESDSMIKSKTIKYIANYLIMGKVILILLKQHFNEYNKMWQYINVANSLFSLVSCKKMPRTKILELEEQNKIY